MWPTIILVYEIWFAVNENLFAMMILVVLDQLKQQASLPRKLAHSGCLKFPGEDKDTELRWIHTQVITEPLHAFFQDGIFMLIFIAVEQLIDA